MKKLLLFTFAFLAISLQAQQYAWTTQNSAYTSAGAYPLSFAMVDANTVWTFAGDGSGGGANLQLYSRTSDGGVTWTSGVINVGGATNTISDIAATSATTAYVIYVTGGASKGGIYKTTNGGTTWTKYTSAPAIYNTNNASFPDIIHFFDANNGVTMGDAVSGVFEIYTTSNGGTTWTKVPAANIPAADAAGEYGYTHLKAVAGNTIWFGTDIGRIYKSNDKGLNWSVVTTPIVDFGGVTTANYSGQITIKDANTGWIMDQDGVLYSTTDAGATWNQVTLSSGTIYTSDLAYVPGTTNTLISAGASTLSRGSSISTDGGVTWTDITPATGDSDGIAGLAVYDISSAYGGGFTTSATVGGMNKLGLVLATSESNATKSTTVFPNPTKGQVNITSKNAINSIQLIDLTGKVVKTFGNIKQLDLSDLKAGTYMLQVTSADGKSSTTKLIKQ